jgi:hypothetical protein
VLPGERWYIGANYSKSEGDDTPTETRSDPKGYRVDAGVYLGANTTLELGVAQSKQRVESFFGCPAPPAPPCGPSLAVETTTDAVGFEVFHLRRFRSLTYSLQGSVSESEPETEVSGLPPFTLTLTSRDGPSSRRYAVAGELFPTDRLGVRLGYSTSDVDGFDVDTDNYDVTATWFFKPRVAMELSLGRSTISGASVSGESESAQIRFTGRL